MSEWTESPSAAIMFPKSFYRHLLPAFVVGLSLRLYFIWHFPFYSGDTAYYEELARNWLYHGVYGLYSHGQLLASDLRAPGYPAFLAMICSVAGAGRTAVMLAQAILDLATCLLAAGIAVRLAVDASEEDRGRVAALALWLTAVCPFTANYAAVPLTEVLATFFTALAILLLLSPACDRIGVLLSNSELLRGVRIWFFAGLAVGLGTLVRPETPLLLFAALAALWLRFRRSANWEDSPSPRCGWWSDCYCRWLRGQLATHCHSGVCNFSLHVTRKPTVMSYQPAFMPGRRPGCFVFAMHTFSPGSCQRSRSN